MSATVSFGEMLESADQLPLEDHVALVEALRKRLIARRREQLAQEILAARQEYAEGQCPIMTPEEIIREALS